MKTSKIEDLKQAIKKEEEKRENAYKRITGVKPSIINKNFFNFNCLSIEEMSKVLNNIKPFKNGYKITDGIYITSHYKLTIKNNYHNRIFQISFENAQGVEFWVSIDFNLLNENFKECYFVETKRGLYDTESVYVNIQPHRKEFKSITVGAFSFQSTGQQVSFYGGNKVLIDENLINEMVESIKEWTTTEK